MKKWTGLKRILPLLLSCTLVFSTPVYASSDRFTIFRVPCYDGFKSYERGILENGRCIFHKNTRQYELQKMAQSTKTGFRMVNRRYLVAVGSRFTEEIGQYVTIVLKNGKRIPCIVGDLKADKDTDESNTFTKNGCCSEFIVDIRRLGEDLKDGGDISEYKQSWDSPVSAIIVHDQNVFSDTE